MSGKGIDKSEGNLRGEKLTSGEPVAGKLARRVRRGEWRNVLKNLQDTPNGLAANRPLPGERQRALFLPYNLRNEDAL